LVLRGFLEGAEEEALDNRRINDGFMLSNPVGVCRAIATRKRRCPAPDTNLAMMAFIAFLRQIGDDKWKRNWPKAKNPNRSLPEIQRVR
jgi:hypothetical protein